MPGFIEDGYTVDSLIKGVDGLYEDLRLTYRPTTATERSTALKAMRSALQSANPKKSELEAARILSERISSWNLCRADGSDVEITPENVARLQPDLSQKVWEMVVLGERASDETPDAKTDRDQEEADEKNSVTG